jgi:hypothetical protein
VPVPPKEFSVDDLEQAARVIIPMVRDAMRPDLHLIAGRCETAIAQASNATDEVLKSHETRLERLEKRDDLTARMLAVEASVTGLQGYKHRAVLIYGAIVVVITAAWHMAWTKIGRKFGFVE